MMHLQWVDRENNKVDTDLFIVADAYLERIEKCNETIGATIPDQKSSAATGSAAAAPQQEVDPQLRDILNQFLANQGAAGQRQPPLSLTSVMTTDVLQGLLTDDKAVAEMQALMPDGQQTKDDLKAALV